MKNHFLFLNVKTTRLSFNFVNKHEENENKKKQQAAVTAHGLLIDTMNSNVVMNSCSHRCDCVVYDNITFRFYLVSERARF